VGGGGLWGAAPGAPPPGLHAASEERTYPAQPQPPASTLTLALTPAPSLTIILTVCNDCSRSLGQIARLLRRPTRRNSRGLFGLTVSLARRQRQHFFMLVAHEITV
jgi:hypothetical protein